MKSWSSFEEIMALATKYNVDITFKGADNLIYLRRFVIQFDSSKPFCYNECHVYDALIGMDLPLEEFFLEFDSRASKELSKMIDKGETAKTISISNHPKS